jgi:hypothetical protein
VERRPDHPEGVHSRHASFTSTARSPSRRYSSGTHSSAGSFELPHELFEGVTGAGIRSAGARSSSPSAALPSWQAKGAASSDASRRESFDSNTSAKGKPPKGIVVKSMNADMASKVLAAAAAFATSKVPASTSDDGAVDGSGEHPLLLSSSDEASTVVTSAAVHATPAKISSAGSPSVTASLESPSESIGTASTGSGKEEKELVSFGAAAPSSESLTAPLLVKSAPVVSAPVVSAPEVGAAASEEKVSVEKTRSWWCC